MTILLFVVGLAFLIIGAEALVRGASRISVSLGVSPLIIGLTVVAFGTSSPELAVSIKSALSGQANIALGTVIGSNIFNILFILGLSALIIPLVVAEKLIRFDVPLMIVLSIIVLIFSLDKLISRTDGLLLFSMLVAYLWFLVFQSRKERAERKEMHAQEFGQSIQAGAIGLFYYAGHAVQHRGENYLIPINAISSISAPEHLRYKTVPLGYILGVVNQSASDLNVVILDSCRNSPFKSFSRDLTRGITRMPSSEGTLIAYSTAPGKVALDGDGDDIHSPYTKHLLKHIKKPGLTIEQVLKKVRASVKKETNGQQTPWYEASIDGDFYFIEGKKKGIADNEPRKVIKVVTVDPKETINIPRQEKQEAKKKIISSVKEFAYLDLDSVKKGKRLSVSQVRELVSGNTLSPTTGAYKGAKIYLHTDGRAYYYKKTSDGKVTEGVSSWVFSGSRICSDLHPLGTNADLSEREVCYRFYKHEEQEFKLKIVHIKLSSHWEKQPIGKSFQTKIIKGRQLQ